MSATAIRNPAAMTREDIVQSAMRRLLPLAARHGAASPQVLAALTRWGRMLDASTEAAS